MIKLSICIPTFNRAQYLKECLDSVLISAREYLSEIEIVISDNASTDNTRNVVEDFARQNSNIKYLRNLKTAEVNRNIYNTAKLGGGEYVWVLGDDDTISEQAISIVLSLINSEYNLIVLNYSIFSKDFLTLLKKRALPFKKDYVFLNHNDLLSKLGLSLGFISIVVIKRSIFFAATESECERYMEYGFSFIYATYAGVVNNCRAYLISNPLVSQRSGNAFYETIAWYKCFAIGSSLVFGQLRRNGYSFLALYSANNRVLRDYVMHDISYRRRSSISLHGIFSLTVSCYRMYWYFWLVCVPLLFCPRILICFANKMYLRFFKTINK
jgi:abequosyltransferase